MSLQWALAALAVAELIVTIALYIRVGRLEDQVGRVLRRKPKKRSGPAVPNPDRQGDPTGSRPQASSGTRPPGQRRS